MRVSAGFMGYNIGPGYHQVKLSGVIYDWPGAIN